MTSNKVSDGLPYPDEALPLGYQLADALGLGELAARISSWTSVISLESFWGMCILACMRIMNVWISSLYLVCLISSCMPLCGRR